MTQIANTSGVYAISNEISGRTYVGSAVNIHRRWIYHRSMLRRGKHHSPAFQRSWDKHGSAAFSWRILESVDDMDTLLSREQFWIDVLNAACPRTGFNVSREAGNRRGAIVSAETRAKLSAAGRGRRHRPESIALMAAAKRGISRSPETIAKMSAAQKGKKQSPETIKKRCAKLIGRKMPREAVEKLRLVHTGRKRSPETRAKISIAFTGRKHTDETKRKISEFQKSRPRKPRDEATKAKISATLTGRAGHKLTSEQRAKIWEGRRREAAKRAAPDSDTTG